MDNLENKETANDFSELKLSYKDYVNLLINKYGPVNADYMIFKGPICYRNNNIQHPEGTEIHHIREDTFANLSVPFRAMICPHEFQKKNLLVYANDYEHAVLHYLIYKETKKLGIGGILNFGLGRSLIQDDDNIIYIKFLRKLLYLCESYNDQVHIEQCKNLIQQILKQPKKCPIMITKVNPYEKKDILHEKIIRLCPIGITSIPSQNFFNQFFNSKRILTYDKIYILRTKNDITAVCAINKQNKIILFNGGVGKIIPFQTINDFYTSMDNYFLFCDKLNNLLLQKLESLVKIIQKENPFACLHGSIIDLDAENHIFYDIKTNCFIGYTASIREWDRRIVHLKSVNNLLPNFSQKQLPTVLSNTMFPDIPQQTFSALKENKDKPIDFYTINRHIIDLQSIAYSKHICRWEDGYKEFDVKEINNIQDLMTKLIGNQLMRP